MEKWKPRVNTRNDVAFTVKMLRWAIKASPLEPLKAFNRGRLVGVMLAMGNDRPLPKWMYRTKGGV